MSSILYLFQLFVAAFTVQGIESVQIELEPTPPAQQAPEKMGLDLGLDDAGEIEDIPEFIDLEELPIEVQTDVLLRTQTLIAETHAQKRMRVRTHIEKAFHAMELSRYELAIEQADMAFEISGVAVDLDQERQIARVLKSNALVQTAHSRIRSEPDSYEREYVRELLESSLDVWPENEKAEDLLRTVNQATATSEPPGSEREK